MATNTGLGEDVSMSEAPDDLTEVQRRLKEIQIRNRGRIRWNVSKHTAEIAIEAIGAGATRGVAGRPTGKPRRRKRHKRLL